MADIPFFLVSIDPHSLATIRHLSDWEACQGDNHKVSCTISQVIIINAVFVTFFEAIQLDVELQMPVSEQLIFSICRSSLDFMTHVIFQKILVGPYAISQHLFLQGGISGRFNFLPTEKTVVLQIWICHLLVRH